jgi:hypothetical protein
LAGGTWENHENLRIAGLQAEIWICYMPNSVLGYQSQCRDILEPLFLCMAKKSLKPVLCVVTL